MDATRKPEPPAYCFRVPNDDEGRAFIASLRKFAHYPHVRRIRLRANGPRVTHALADGESPRRYFQDLPMRHAEAVRVYMDTRSPAESWCASYSQQAREWAERHLAERKAHDITRERARFWQGSYTHATECLDSAERECAALRAELSCLFGAVPEWARRFFKWLHNLRETA